jgi:hypothetical protein
MKWVSSWIEVHAPVRSGTINKPRWIFGTFADMYECYKRIAVSAHFPIRSKSFVINLSYKLKIKVPKYDRYVCPKCFSSPHQSAPQIDSEHTILVNYQYSWYIHLLNNLQPNQCVIVQDYTTIHEELTRKLAFSTLLLQLQKWEKILSTKLPVTMTSLDIWSNLRNRLSWCGIIFSLSIFFHNSKVESIFGLTLHSAKKWSLLF